MPKNTKPKMPEAEFAEFVKVLRPAMQNTFNTTASDLEEACRSCGERLTNAGAVESCLDGGGLMRMYGNDGGRAEDALDAATKKYDYEDIFKRLCKAVRLV